MIRPTNSVIFISMYTPKTKYEGLVPVWRNAINLVRPSLEFKLYEIKNTGRWVKNCQQSAMCILDAMCKFERDVVYTDIDSTMHKYPELFFRTDADLAAYICRYPEKNQLCSGTVFAKNCSMTRKMLTDWIILNEDNDEWDDNNLYDIIKKYNVAKFEILPEEYCRIDGNRIQKTSYETAVIRHHQFSRTIDTGAPIA